MIYLIAFSEQRTTNRHHRCQYGRPYAPLYSPNSGVGLAACRQRRPISWHSRCDLPCCAGTAYTSASCRRREDSCRRGRECPSVDILLAVIGPIAECPAVHHGQNNPEGQQSAVLGIHSQTRVP